MHCRRNDEETELTLQLQRMLFLESLVIHAEDK